MLVLSRKPGETIRIGNDITITVVRTGAGDVRLGIEAPRAVPVVRGELPPLSPAIDHLLVTPVDGDVVDLRFVDSLTL